MAERGPLITPKILACFILALIIGIIVGVALVKDGL